MPPAGLYRESALSEVVGFVLLIAVIITAFSLYVTYGVPIQGRDNEIRHMDVVKDSFTTYKIGVDSLWGTMRTNAETDATFAMGTRGASAQGTMGILPLVAPVGSSGVLSINRRTASPEIFQISSSSYITNKMARSADPELTLTSAPAYVHYTNPPEALVVNITGITTLGKGTSPARAVIVSGTDSHGESWQAWINVTPVSTFYLGYVMPTPHTACSAAQSQNGTAITVADTTGAPACLVPITSSQYTGTSLTLSVFKNTTQTLSNVPLYSAVTPQSPYSVDLLDPAYGLGPPIQGSSSIAYQISDPQMEGLAATVSGQYAYILQPGYTYTVPLGSIQYDALNHYWIRQSYYYQMGGVFLSQYDGVLPYLSPAVSFTYDKANPGLIDIVVAAIAFDQNNALSIGGSAPVQIGTTMDSDSGDLPYAALTANTMNATITITSPDSRAITMWRDYFEEAANRTGGIPNDQDLYVVGNTTTSAYISFKGTFDPTKNSGINAATPDISLRVKTVNLTAAVIGTGGTST